MKTNNLRTIDEFCNQPKGSFKKFIEKKETFIKQIEQERKDRMRGVKSLHPIPDMEMEEMLSMMA